MTASISKQSYVPYQYSLQSEHLSDLFLGYENARVGLWLYTLLFCSRAKPCNPFLQHAGHADCVAMKLSVSVDNS